jgi:hypothetical protein
MVDAAQQEIDVGAPAYEGLNAAHRNFFGEFKYLNALYYVFVSAKDKLRTHTTQNDATLWASPTSFDPTFVARWPLSAEAGWRYRRDEWR